METDVILKEKKCFDDLDKNTSKEEVFQSTNILEHIKQELNKVPIEFREILINELSQHTPHAAIEVINTTKNAKKVPPPMKLIFGWRESAEQLTRLMEEIQDQIQLFADRSMVSVFVRMATSEDLSQENEKMYIACKTNLFSYIVERLEPYCISFNPTTIERSGLFVSKAGNPIKASCLYNSKIQNISLKKIIDAIFKKIC